MVNYIHLLLIPMLSFGCRQTATSDKLFEAIAPSQSGITFSNQLTESAT